MIKKQEKRLKVRSTFSLVVEYVIVVIGWVAVGLGGWGGVVNKFDGFETQYSLQLSSSGRRLLWLHVRVLWGRGSSKWLFIQQYVSLKKFRLLLLMLLCW